MLMHFARLEAQHDPRSAGDAVLGGGDGIEGDRGDISRGKDKGIFFISMHLPHLSSSHYIFFIKLYQTNQVNLLSSSGISIFYKNS